MLMRFLRAGKSRTVVGDVKRYSVKCVKWADYARESHDLIIRESGLSEAKSLTGEGNLITLSLRDGSTFTALTACDAYACNDNGDTIERI